MFCTGCGTQSIDSGAFCGGCGTSQRNTSAPETRLASAPAAFQVGHAMQQPALPDGIRGWSWGAFFLNWIWAIGNQTWIGLLALVPYVNVPIAIWLGLKGREMAWRNGNWDSVAHFNHVQRKWSQWGIGVAIVMAFATAALMISIVYSVVMKPAPEASEAILQDSEPAATSITSQYKTG